MSPLIRRLGLPLLLTLCPAIAVAEDSRVEQLGAYHFTVEIAGVTAGFFKGVDGLNAKVEVVQHAEGDYVFLRQQAGSGKTAYPTIVLKPGFTANEALVDWWKQRRDLARTVRVSLVQLPTRKGKRVAGTSARKLCSFTLNQAKLSSYASTKKKDGEREVKASLVAHELTHTCQRIMLRPGEKPKR